MLVVVDSAVWRAVQLASSTGLMARQQPTLDIVRSLFAACPGLTGSHCAARRLLQDNTTPPPECSQSAQQIASDIAARAVPKDSEDLVTGIDSQTLSIVGLAASVLQAVGPFETASGITEKAGKVGGIVAPIVSLLGLLFPQQTVQGIPGVRDGWGNIGTGLPCSKWLFDCCTDLCAFAATGFSSVPGSSFF